MDNSKRLVRTTFVHSNNSALYHHTLGERHVYLHFKDRNTTIKYSVFSTAGKKIINTLKKRGNVKYTYAKSN